MAGGVHGSGVCMAGEACKAGEACMAGGMHGSGACVAGDTCYMNGGGSMHGRYYEIRSMSGRYASYWNAFLIDNIFAKKLHENAKNKLDREGRVPNILRQDILGPANV